MSLQKAVQAAIAELKAQTGYPPHYVNAPHIREIGDRLQIVLDQCPKLVEESSKLRPDVLAFAEKMSAVMGTKEAEKGSTEALPISEPLMKLDYYVEKLKEFGAFDKPEEMSRTLIHIANFAMIAEGKIK